MAGTTHIYHKAAWPPGVHSESPRTQQKCVAWKSRCSPRGAAALRPGLMEKIPGGVLKCGYPGSDGEQGCGLSWLRARHAGGGTGLPGSAWRAGQNGFFYCPHLEYFTLVTRKPHQTLAHGNPSPSSPVGYPVSGRRGGFPLWLGSECAPRRAEGAPRGHVECRAKPHIVCYSAVHALKMFLLGSRFHLYSFRMGGGGRGLVCF